MVDGHIELPRRTGDRVVMALVCPIMFCFLGLALLAVWHEWHPESLGGIACKILVEEAIFAFAAVFGLAFIWSVFAPQWVAKLVKRLSRKVVLATIVLFSLALGLFVAMEWRGGVQ